MKNAFKLTVVPASEERPRNSDENARESIRILILEDGNFLIGVSSSHIDLWNSFSIMSGLVYMPNIFAQGKYEKGVIEFDKDTPLWKQDEILRYLSGQALQMLVQTFGNELFVAAAVIMLEPKPPPLTQT